MISQFGVTTNSATSLNGKNSPAVIVTAELPPFAKRPASRCNNFHSWPVKIPARWHFANDTFVGADGQTYAVAQGNLLVGGLGVAGNDGSSLIVNVPTVGRIPGGATVEQLIETDFLSNDNLILNLHQDFPLLIRSRRR